MLTGLLAISSLCSQAQNVPAMNSVATRPITVLAPVVVPAPPPDPQIPTNLPAAASDQNFKLWIYDPRERNIALASNGIFIRSATVNWTFVGATGTGYLYRKLDPGQYDFDVLEPTGTGPGLTRKSYSATVSATGVVSMIDKVADARGIFAVTVNSINPVAQQRISALTAIANESALTFNPTSTCQLIDQVTPSRSLSTDLSAGFPRVRTRLPSYGRIRALIVPIDFTDIRGNDNPVTFFTPTANNMRDFYHTQSYGRLAFDFSIVSSWVRMPFAATKYNLGDGSTSKNYSGYVAEIVSSTDAAIDYNDYDAVYFLIPREVPYSVMAFGPAITYPITTRNGYITNGATGGADMYLAGNGLGADWKWLAHETGHAFGLYDEDLDHASQTLGHWSVMANNWSRTAIELGGWDRYLLGWHGDTQATCLPKHQLTTAGTLVKLNPIVRQNTETKVAMVPLSTSKMLILESRKREGLDLIDVGREGVLAYTVDMKLGQLKGGYRTIPRPGSTDTANFSDAALRTGDTITIDGVVVNVVQLATSGDTILLKATTDAILPVLSVTRSGSGVGTVTSNPAGINCTPTCFANFASSTSVSLTATPATGFIFGGWSGECTGTSTCTVAMGSAKNVTAVFTRPAGLAQRGGVDVDGLGKSTLVARSMLDGQLQIGRLVNNVFQWTTAPGPGSDFRLIASVDFAGNGKSDLPMLRDNPALLNANGQGTAQFWPDFNSTSSVFLRDVKPTWDVQAVGDLDGDGFGDLVWRFRGQSANFDDQGVSYIWFTNGSAVTQVRKRGGAPLTWTLLGAADLNSDGAADMLYVSPGNTVRALMSTASRTCANLSAGTIPAGFTALKIADFTGRRRGDMLLKNNSTGEVRLISLDAVGLVLPTFTGDPDDQNASCSASTLNVNQTTFNISTIADPAWSLYATGDFNGDGIFDIAWRRSDGRLTVWLMATNGGTPTVIVDAGVAPVNAATLPLQ